MGATFPSTVVRIVLVDRTAGNSWSFAGVGDWTVQPASPPVSLHEDHQSYDRPWAIRPASDGRAENVRRPG